MDIGTAKPTLEEMDGIKHYMMDFLPPSTNYSVADYVRDANSAIKEILDKNKLPEIRLFFQFRAVYFMI